MPLLEEHRQHGDAGDTVTPGDRVEGPRHSATDGTGQAAADERTLEAQGHPIDGGLRDAKQGGHAGRQGHALELGVFGFEVDPEHGAGDAEYGTGLQSSEGVIA
ncbi:hypothetical protein D3C71_1502670 [compost metagenome]